MQFSITPISVISDPFTHEFFKFFEIKMLLFLLSKDRIKVNGITLFTLPEFMFASTSEHMLCPDELGLFVCVANSTDGHFKY
jgi:hypothetical protein